jgi:hypothetical protein
MFCNKTYLGTYLFETLLSWFKRDTTYRLEKGFDPEKIQWMKPFKGEY